MTSDTTARQARDGAGPATTWSLMPAPVVIQDVQHPRTNRDALTEGHLDAPRVGQASDVYSLTVGGWAVGESCQVTGIEITAGGEVRGRAAVDRARTDVVAYLGEGTPLQSGFSCTVSVLGMPEEFELGVQAILEDGTRKLFSVVRGRVHLTPLPAPDPPLPLLMVTLGRTGSTWLSRLLGCHPAVLAYKPFAYEPRVLSYWCKVLLALGDPRSYMQTLAARLTTERWWLGDDALKSVRPPDASVGAALGHSGVDELAEFARQQTRAVYAAIARVENKTDALLFSEKVAPERPVLEVADWLFPATRRVYLVRDPRDMALSILAYNDRNGQPGFGSERIGSPDGFLDDVVQSISNMLALFRSDRSSPLLVRYEDLISAPHRELSRVFAAADIDASAATVERVVSAARERLPGMDEHRTSTSMAASVGRWRRELSDQQQALWTNKFADVLRECGYDTGLGDAG